MSTDQYEAVCKERFDEINAKLDTLHNRLFVDNGSPSMQSRLNRNERIIKALLWVVMVVGAASIAQVTKGVYNHFHKPQMVSEVTGE